MIHLTLVPRLAVRAALCAVAAFSLANCKDAKEATDQPANGDSKSLSDKIAEGAKEIGTKAAEGTKAAGEKIGEGAKELGTKAVEGAKAAGEKIGEGAQAVGEKIGEGAKAAGEAVKKAAGDAVKKAVTPDP